MKDSKNNMACCNGYASAGFSDDTKYAKLYLNGLFTGNNNSLSSPARFGVTVEIAGSRGLIPLKKKEIEMEFDPEKGVARQCAELHENGQLLQLQTEVFASACQRELIASRVTLLTEKPAKVRISVYLCCTEDWETIQEEESEDALCILCCPRQLQNEEKSAYACIATSSWSDEADFLKREIRDESVATVYEVETVPDEPVRIEQLLLGFTDAEYTVGALTGIALRSAARNRDIGYDELLQQQSRQWADFWKRTRELVPEDKTLSEAAVMKLYHIRESLFTGDRDRIPMAGADLASCWKNTMLDLPFYLYFCAEEPDPTFWFGQAFDNAIRTEWANLLKKDKEKQICEIADHTVEKAALLTQAVLWYEKYGKADGYKNNAGLNPLSKAAQLCLEAAELPVTERSKQLALRCVDEYLNACADCSQQKKSPDIERMKAFAEKNAYLRAGGEYALCSCFSDDQDVRAELLAIIDRVDC